MTDGLALLNEQREQRRRSIPPPRHPTRPAARSVPDRRVETTDDAAAELPAPEAAVQARDVANGERQQLVVDTKGRADDDSAELYRSTIYFGQAEDQFLEDVRTVARRSKPKVDATRSAVVRLAVRRMLGELSAAEVVAELRAEAPQKSGTPGRPRL